LALTDRKVAIIGSGISGLSAGYHLHRQNAGFQIFEADDHIGGLARSFQWHGIDCDMAPHRLFTQDTALLNELLALVPCRQLQRKSSILVAGKWISDPVNIVEIVTRLHPVQSLKLIVSFISAQIQRRNRGESFSSFVRSIYGTALDELFFRPYAEKLFGIPSTEISRRWGERKVRVSGLRDMVRKNSKLYFDHFFYPQKGGYGAIAGALSRSFDASIRKGHRLKKIEYDGARQKHMCTFQVTDNDVAHWEGDVVISCIPLPALLNTLGHEVDLTYRPSKLVYLHIDRQRVMADHWVYFVDSTYRVNRMAEFKNFAPDSRTGNTVICAEVTRTEGFSVEGVVAELSDIGLIRPENVLDSKVIHIENAYPIYSISYSEKVDTAGQILKQYPNLFNLGRQAQFQHLDVDEIYAASKKLIHGLSGGGG
jgi:protoporphyrinogen oxidase